MTPPLAIEEEVRLADFPMREVQNQAPPVAPQPVAPIYQQLSSVTIYGSGGGRRVFNQAEDGAIWKAAWDPRGAMYGREIVVSSGFARQYTPLAAVCWGGALGFREVTPFAESSSLQISLIHAAYLASRFVSTTCANGTSSGSSPAQIPARSARGSWTRPSSASQPGAICPSRIRMASCT